MISALVVLLAVQAATTPPSGAPPASPAMTGVAEWEQPLSSRPAAPPASLKVAGGDEILVVLLEQSVEARRVADGALVWRRDDLDGGGLSRVDAQAAERGTLAWAGARPGAGPLCAVISLSNGATTYETALPATPVGPPVVVADAAGAAFWFVPLDGGVVARVNAERDAVETFKFDGKIAARLLPFADRVLAAVEDGRRVFTIGGPSRRTAARELPTAHAVVSGAWIVAPDSRSVSAWKCKRRGAGSVSCSRKWRQPLGGAVSAPPLFVDQTVLVSALDSHLYAFRLSDGHLRWRRRLGVRVATPLVLWNDLVAALPDATGEVLFFRVGDGEPAGGIAAGKDEIFLAGAARSGDLLITPVLPYPALQPLLRAHRVAPRAAAAPSLPESP